MAGDRSGGATRERASRLALPAGSVQGVLGLAMVVASLWLIDESVPGPGLRNLLPVLGTVLILRAGMHPGNPVSRLLATRPLVALGDVSYSWYLWHWPLIVFAVLLWPDRPLVPVTAAVVSLAPSIASYRWVEQPIRQARDMTRARWARLLAFTLIPPLALSATILWVAGNGYWSTAVINYQQARVSHVDMTTDCAAALPVLDPGWDRCWWNATATGKPIYLLGDSNAGHFSEAAIVNASAITDAGVLDLRDYFCPNSMCASRQGELVLYADAGHVSVAASEALVDRFAQRISESSSSAGAGPAGG